MKKETRKRRPWLWLLPVLALAALALGLWVVPKGSTQPAAENNSREEDAASAPYLAEEDSFFSEFTVREDKVYILCCLSIINPTDETLPVTITGDFSADYDAGLVTERELPALYLTQEAQPDPLWSSVAGFLPVESEGSERNILPQTQEAAELFLLAPGGNVFWAVFIGPHGESTQKQDRLLPPIRIETVEGLRCVVKLNGKTVTIGRESAELLWLCRNALTKSFPDALVDRGSRLGPGISLNFQAGEALNTNSPSHSYFGDYIIFYNDVCNYSAAPMLDLAMNVQLSAGTYDRVLAALEKAGVPVGEPAEEPEAAPRSCTVEYGGGQRTVQDETAAELYRICEDARSRGQRGHQEETKREILYMELFFLDERDPVGGPFCRVCADDSGWIADGLVYMPESYAFPAGTFAALLDVLDRSGELPAPAGQRIAGNEVYGLFEEDGVYALQLYSPEGDLVWAFGPGNHEPRVAEEEPGLWSVSLSAGPSLSLHWSVYYRPETRQLSDSIYGILARDGERVLCISGKSLLLREIFSGGGRLVLDKFFEPLAQTMEPFVSAAFTEDSRAVAVTYLAGEDYHEVTETIPLPREGGTSP